MTSPWPIRNATRRDVLRGMGVLGVATLLGGCGDGGGSQGAGDTRRLDTAYGPVEVPERAQRVAVIDGYTPLDTAVLVGAPIVAASRAPFVPGGFPEYLDATALADVPDAGWDEIDLELLAEVRPDLILAADWLEDGLYRQISQIAPVVAFENIAYNWEDPRDWERFQHAYADALGRSGPLDEEAARIGERIEALREQLAVPAEELTVSVVRIGIDSFQLYPGQGPGSATLAELGVRRPVGQRPEDEPGNISLERVPDLDGDVLIVFGLDEDEEHPDYFEQQLTRNPLWENLEVVQVGQVHIVDSAPWNHAGSAQSVQAVLDDLERILPGVTPLEA